MSENDSGMRTNLSRDAKWLIGVLLVIACPVFGFQWRQSSEVSGAMVQLGGLQKSVDKLTTSVEKLLLEDVSDIKSRLTIMESKQILPRAESDIRELNEKFRQLERQFLERNRGEG